MPLIWKEGKDTIIFASKEDHAAPSKIELPPPEPKASLILPNGEINWNCPCLGGMATGPCGLEFREAFSCFHYSTSEQKGSDCYEAFKTMRKCMAGYPTLYESKGGSEDLFDDEDEEDAGQTTRGSAKSENKAMVNDAKDSAQTVNVSSTKQEVERNQTN